jgi:predicted choloylglycine hydrolase
VSEIPFTFRAVSEDTPGLKWQALFAESWPFYRRWFLQEGDRARPSYVTSRRMLERHMPELVGVYDQLVELAGGGDTAARMLSLYRPPPYFAGCSQAALTRAEPVLIRNYDYAPARLEGIVARSRWDGRCVIGMTDCLWGLLDGMNDAGLACSLAFGGRRVVGDGFGIPIVIRYLLQTCTTVAEARDVLRRVPVNLSHNVTLLDTSGDAATVFVAPDRDPVFRALAVATNHQDDVAWPEHALLSHTLEREWVLRSLVTDPAASIQDVYDAFLSSPLHSAAYSRGFGTLYTAIYLPARGEMQLRWPRSVWTQSMTSFTEGVHTELLVESDAA